MHEEIIQKLCDRQVTRINDKKNILIKNANSCITSYQNSKFDSIAIQNLISNLTIIQSQVA